MLKSALRVEKNRQLGRGSCGCGKVMTIDERLRHFGIDDVHREQHGEGFFGSLLSVLSVLPIPVVSDVARTVAIAKTGVDTLTGHSDPALGGLITKALSPLAKAVPAIGKPAEALAKSVGFGVDSKKSPQYVALFHLVDILSKSLPKITKMIPEKRDPVLKTYKNLKELLLKSSK